MSQAATLCDNCNAAGLPILPVRYVPVPGSVKQTVPAWASDDRVTGVSLGSEFHYALRTLRAGYVYLFYSKNARGANLWECYAVTQDGCLVKAPDPLMAPPQPEPTVQCSRLGHANSVLHHLLIERPDKCGTTWIAFSEHMWSEQTLKTYSADASLRQARMQALEPAAMAGGAKNSHSTPASVAALEEVIEYAADFSTSWLAHDLKVGSFGNEDGSYERDVFTKVATRYPWHQRQGAAATDLKMMRVRAEKLDGTQNTPHVLALWDAVGTTHELNGFRNDAAGRVAMYSQQLELQIACCNYLQELQTAAAGAAVADEEAQRTLAFSATAQRQQGSGRAMRQLAAQHPGDARYAEAATLQTQWETEQVPSTYSQRMYMVLQHYPANLWRGEIDKLKQEVDGYVANRGPNHQKDLADVRLHSWDRFDKYIDTPGALNTFKRNWSAFQDSADKLIDARTEPLVRWLEAPLLLDTLEDCRPGNVVDGVIFEDKVGEAIFGIGSSASGAKKLDAWVREARASVRSNLLWRAVALNQQEGVADVDAALAAAQSARSARTVADAFNLEANLSKVGKALFGVHKNAASIFKDNTGALATDGAKAFGARIKPVRTRGFDKILVTAGDAIVRGFKVDGIADYLCEKIVQHMLSMRALIAPEDSRTLVVMQAADEPASRGQLLRRLAAADTFLASASTEMQAAQSQRLKAAWDRIKLGGDDKLRAPRIAALVIFVEALNFNKLLYDCYTKNDWKSWTTLAASGMTITSGLLDIASNPVKEELALLGDKGAASWSLQRLKLAGGVLSAGATAIGVVWDGVSAKDALKKRRYLLTGLYAGKAVLGAFGGAFALATTFTHAAPLLGKLWKGEALQGAAEAAGARAAAGIGARILFMSVGAWLSVGTFAIQIIIWMQPDDLQVWCDHCAFGKSRDKEWDANKQYQELEKALMAIGIA